MRNIFLLIILIPAIFLALGMVRFNRGKRGANEQFQNSSFEKITNFGTTAYLEIIPLIDWYTCSDNLKGEAGVSYLIKTDKKSVLFDVGFNYPAQSNPSPLLHNMKQLGIVIEDFDTIIISHNHPDHVGGRKWQVDKTFFLTTNQINLGEKEVYTPVQMSYPGLSPICIEKPTVIAEGIASIGTIPKQLFLAGWTLE